MVLEYSDKCHPDDDGTGSGNTTDLSQPVGKRSLEQTNMI